MRRYGAFIVCAILGCSAPTRTHAPAVEVPPPARPFDAEVATNMALLATGHMPDPAESEAWTKRITGGESIDTYIDALLSDPRFAQSVGPRVVTGDIKPGLLLPRGYVLKQTDPDKRGRVIYYLRQPCSPESAVEVKAWWDARASVLSCPDSYRPERFVDNGRHCDAFTMSPTEESAPFCGCGPSLMRCYPNVKKYLTVVNSTVDEIVKTAARVIADDRP